MRHCTNRQQLDTSRSLTLAYVVEAFGVNAEFIDLLLLENYLVKLIKEIM